MNLLNLNDIRKEYFIFRRNQDEILENKKLELLKKKKEEQKNIESKKYISLQKINFHISLYKNNIKRKNKEKLSLSIYETLLTTFSYDVQEKYESRKEIIMNYIANTLENILDLKELRASQKIELIDYKETLKGKINLQALESAYVEMKRTLSNFKYGSDKQEFYEYKKELQESRKVADEMVLEILDKKTISLKEILNIVKNTESEISIEIPEKTEIKIQTEKTKIKTPKLSEKDILEILMGKKETLKDL